MLGKKFLRNLIIVTAIVVFVVILMTVVDKSSLKLAYKYYTLTNKPSRSDLQFNVPTGRIFKNADGTTSLKFEMALNLSDSDVDVKDDDYEGAEGDDDRQHPHPDEDTEDENKPNGTNLVSIMGDSISTYDGTIPSGYANFYPSGDITSIDHQWWKIYIDSIGAELGVNGSWSGSSVSGGDDSAGQSDNRVNALGNKGDPSIIIIYLGTNDLWNGVSQSEFGSAYETMLSKIKNKYPAAKVLCLGLTQLSSDPNTGAVVPLNSGNGDSKDFSNIIKSKASAAGFTYVSLDGCWDYTEAGTYCIDGMVHPNSKGMKKIAEKIPK